MATQVVAEVGLDRLEEVGLGLQTETAPTLWQPELTEAEGDMVYGAYDDCLDLERRDVEGFMTDGLTEAQARCVSQGYRGSGIPGVHMLEPPHLPRPARPGPLRRQRVGPDIVRPEPHEAESLPRRPGGRAAAR